MARITVNETGTNPIILVSTTVSSNAANISSGTLESNVADTLSVGCLQDVTITASTGVFSWTDFCSIDTNKIPTPADNEVTTNIVIDSTKYFGNTGGTANAASTVGIADLSQDKVPVQFVVIWNSNGSGNAAGNIANLLTDTARSAFATTNDPIYWSSGVGYITNLAPTVSPDAPVWVSPMTIAVDGTLYNGQNV
jgi:hypothetical protein